MSSKNCIWCRKDSSETSFQNVAHTIPQSLGGIDICQNVCDQCNYFFGTIQNKIPSIETVLKETFNVSRARFLHASNEIGKNKALNHFSSLFFDVSFKKMKIDIKPTFKLKKGFQDALCRQFKRGLFKVFLEETERQNGNGSDNKFDFIREFARYDLGDYPVLYFSRKVPMLYQIIDETKHPKFHFDNVMNYQIKGYNFFEFELFGHLLSIPVSRNYILMVDQYIFESVKSKSNFFYPPIKLKYLTEMDLLLKIFND